MKIKSLRINKLFNRFNHTIDFKNENITIITAPNGHGKTVCLKILDAIFNQKFIYLSKLEFSSIELHTENNGILFFEKKNVKDSSFEISHSSNEKIHTFNNSIQQSAKNIDHIINKIPFLHRIGPNLWEDMRDDTRYTTEELFEDEYMAHHLPEKLRSPHKPEWYNDLICDFKVHFIQDQRLINKELLKRNYGSYINTIEKYAKELSEIIQICRIKSVEISQNLDSTFPSRLLKKGNEQNHVSQDYIINELNSLQLKRNELSKFNLLLSDNSIDQITPEDLKVEDLKVFNLYIEDTKEKLEPYNEIYKKINLFNKILNEKHLAYKSIKISSERGFYFETIENEELELTQLSSGEQHQVVLLYELIFKTNEHTLILIDEPEISLHVTWQKEFLQDIEKIKEIQKNMVVVIATHSPQIINGRWDLAYDLLNTREH
ncbi:hypothetical protein HMPREF2844_06030 [Neisseria sp. HMSC072F04]|jgi:hypothetical protein|uniref:AAA family ATPase n=1 Tax=Neisseria sicca TaxID=490 RepID=UPI0008A5B559|nr:AAA family ATPase [Neisseria sicca]OFJ79010.1 hypothetical protein HMPREF2844_06030 [Neisseria sp. HMSC072F04]